MRTAGKIFVVSNRGSYTLKETENGIVTVPSVSGLVSAVEPVLKQQGGVWISWGGREAGPQTKAVRLPIPQDNPLYYFHEVLLTPEEIQNYYHGFTNRALWPLCHYFLERCTYDPKEWSAYVKVNNKFAAALLTEFSPGSVVWINDYHLALVPGICRREMPDARLVFFWHIPFPHYDLFSTLPWAREMLQGLLGSTIIGFHLEDYALNFMDTVRNLLGAVIDYENYTVSWQGRLVRVRACPMGIDFAAFQDLAGKAETQAKARALREQIGTEFVALGVERLDYTKGILERLLAFENFLQDYPSYRGRLSLIQVAVPSRGSVKAYQQLRSQVEEAVGRINGRFSEGHYRPVHYFYRALPREELVSYYLAADIMLVTPLRDGLNLVAKEYVASRIDEDGVLILSKFAGAARELKGALLVNPYDIDGTARALQLALTLPAGQRRQRMQALREMVRKQDLRWWLQNFHLGSAGPKSGEIIVPRRVIKYSARQKGTAVDV
ncbi:MAG: trehalose 6-phosphate synthase/phosphatase [Clostridia bacterium]|nr:trehalose 6-phosphate synthase/phosphatase [Clostridia bacterium]